MLLMFNMGPEFFRFFVTPLRIDGNEHLTVQVGEDR